MTDVCGYVGLERFTVEYHDDEDILVLLKFRAKAQDKFENKKGAIKKALLEALTLWVKAN